MQARHAVCQTPANSWQTGDFVSPCAAAQNKTALSPSRRNIMQTQHRAPALRFSDHPATFPSRRQAPRVTVIVQTRHRPAELASVLWRLRQLPERPRLIVLDNASPHAVAVAHIARSHEAELVRVEQPEGEAACNRIVANVTTPHVAFCDDSTWWEPGALAHACDLLDEYPHIGVINGRVLLDQSGKEHPLCERMQHSTLDRTGLPGPALITFMANAVVMRTRAFRHAEGYEPQVFAGIEEALIGLSLVALGWRIVYAPEVILHQLPAAPPGTVIDPTLRARNRLWVAWLRLPWREAWRETRSTLGGAWRDHRLLPVLWQSLRPLSWLVLRRRAVPELVAEMHRAARDTLSLTSRPPTQAPPRRRARPQRSGNMPPC